MLRINVTTAEAVITETELITSGRKGLRCAFTFSDDWAGLAKTVIVQGAATRDIALLATNEITVPAECVDKAQFPLKIGVYGARADGSIAIPTIWASFGKILPGVKPSDIPPDELTPDVVAQIQEAANNALYLARNVQSMADGGALDGVSPAVTVTSITGGHNVKITDRDHPDGQDFDVPDGEDGADGSGVWYTTGRVSGEDNPFVLRRDLIGREGATVQVHDLLFAPDVRDEGEPTTLYEITSVGTACALKRLCKMQGEDGTSPGVTITEIEGGHRVTITDEAHPDGQSFDVMDGTGGSGSSDYNDLSNKPQIAGVTLSGDKSLADLGIAAASDIPTVPVQSVNGKTGTVVLNASDVGAGTYSKPSGGIPKSDLASAVQTSLAKADTALQSAPVTSVNGQTGAVTLSIPSTASDVGAVSSNQGVSNANKVLTVNSSGVVVPEDNRFVVTLTPTAADYSGVMDKNVAEINAAYNAGKKVLFRVLTGASSYAQVDCTNVVSDGSETFPSYGGYLVDIDNNILIYAFTSYTSRPDKDSYSTRIYPLATGQWTGGSY